MASIVSVTIVMLSIVGYALAWSGFLRLPLALTLISACCAIACVLYAGALAGVLYPIQVVVLWGGVAALAVWIVRTPRPELRRQLTAPATIAFVVGCVVLFVVTRGLVLTDWDDFANWGAISKVLLLTDRLPREPESLLFLYYPPGDALFQYFVAKPLAYSEGNMLFGHAVFQWAAIMPILATVRWRDCVLGISLLAISIVAGYLLGSPYANWTTLMVDVEIALLFAAVLTIYLLGGGGVRAILCTVPVVADLPIIKEAGFLYALMFAVMVLADKTVSALWVGVSIRQTRRSAAAGCALLVALPTIMKAAWDAHVRHIGAPPLLDLSWSHIQARLNQPDFAPTLSTVVAKLGDALHGRVPIGDMPSGLWGWFALVGVLAGLAVLVQRTAEDRLRTLCLQLLLAAFFAITFVLLGCYYAFAFVPYEAVQLAGINRYLGGFLLTWLLMSVALIVYGGNVPSRRWIVTPLIALVAGGAIYLTRGAVAATLTDGPRGDAYAQEMLKVRHTVQDRLTPCVSETPINSSVYVIWNNTMGLQFYMSMFELRPRRVNDYGFSFGPKRFDGDIWSSDLTPELLRSRLQGYDFVFLGQADDVFWNRYASLFASGAREAATPLFRVDKSNGEELLSPVPTVAQMAK